MRWRPVLLLLLAGCTFGTEPSGRSTARPGFAVAGSPALLLGAGDIARCGPDGLPSTSNRSRATSDLLVARPSIPIFTLGDNEDSGTLTAFRNCYAPSWGRVKDRTIFPTPGNHDYLVAGASGYFDYFNGVRIDSGIVGKRGQGYYARDYGGARIYGLNSELSATARAAMVAWVKADLRAHPRACQVAFIHRPFFVTSAETGNVGSLNLRALMDALVAGGVEMILAGHIHQYERFERKRADGTPDPRGIRQMLTGTGGSGTISPVPLLTSRARGSQALDNSHGIIRLAIYSDRIKTEFIPIAGKTFTDTATTWCTGHSAPPAEIHLTVKGEKRTDGRIYMTLDWSGATGANVDVWRNGALLTVQINDGYYVNSKAYAPGTLRYKVCETGSSKCSNEVSVAFT